MRLWMLAPVGLALLTAACGNTDEQRAATGGIGGAVAGAAVGGPVGAVVGAGVGGAGGAYRDEAQAKVQEMRNDNKSGNTASNRQGGTTNRQTASNNMPQGVDADELRQAQTALRDQGLYKGQVDGIYGPQTRQALDQYRQQNNMQSASLEQAIDSLNNQTASTGDQPDSPQPQQPAR